MISCNFLPFKLVDSPELQNLIQCLNPAINLKSRYFYSDLAGKYAKEIIEEVKKLISCYHYRLTLLINNSDFTGESKMFLKD